MKNHAKKTQERGSVIVWILIAIALIAALTFTFNRSSNNSVSLLTDEQAKTYANQLIAYANDIKQTVKRLQLRGCEDTDISFENDIVSGYTNPFSPTDGSCHVFDINGGGLTWQTISSPILDSSKLGEDGYGHAFFPNPIQLLGVGTDCATEDCTDMIIDIPYITEDVCNAINDKVNMNYTYTHESIENFIYRDLDKFQGTYIFYNAGSSSTIGDETNSMGSGFKMGCYPRGVVALGGQFFSFYASIISR